MWGVRVCCAVAGWRSRTFPRSTHQMRGLPRRPPHGAPHPTTAFEMNLWAFKGQGELQVQCGACPSLGAEIATLPHPSAAVAPVTAMAAGEDSSSFGDRKVMEMFIHGCLVLRWSVFAHVPAVPGQACRAAHRLRSCRIVRGSIHSAPNAKLKHQRLMHYPAAACLSASLFGLTPAWLAESPRSARTRERFVSPFSPSRV